MRAYFGQGRTIRAAVRRLKVAGLAMVSLGVCGRAVPPPGSLDAGFDPSRGGERIGLAQGESVQVNAIAVQLDGRILVGGHFTGADGVPCPQIARLNPDGTVDRTFLVPGGAGGSEVQDVAVQPDGGILVTDGTDLRRYKPDGAWDESFQPPATAVCRRIILQSDGKVLVGGGTGAPEYVDRLHPDGIRDTSFTRQEYWGRIESMALQADGKLLVAGGRGREPVVRLNADGTRDSGFAVTIDDDVWVVLPAPGGKVYVGGMFWQVNGATRHGVARLNEDGSLDATFDPRTSAPFPYRAVYAMTPSAGGGVIIGGALPRVSAGIEYCCGNLMLVQLAPDGTENHAFTEQLGDLAGLQYQSVRALARQPDGRILAGGGIHDRGLFRRLADGGADAGFTVNLQGDPGMLSQVVRLPDGKVLAAGSFTSVNGARRPGLARLDRDGLLDPDFNPGLPAGYRALALARRPDGRVIVSATTGTTSGGELFQLASDGSRDPTFVPDPRVRTEYMAGHSLVLLPSGGLLLANYPDSVYGTSQQDILRLNANGALDPGFRARITYGPMIGYWVPVLMVVQPDGRILAGGSFEVVNGLPRLFLARLEGDGRVDPTFRAAIGRDEQYLGYGVCALALQPDGRVLVGLTVLVEGSSAPVVLRLNPDGGLDGSFHLGAGATAETEVAAVSTLQVQSDGFILAGGRFDTFHGVEQPNLIRLTPHGRVDPAFRVEWIATPGEIEPWEIGGVRVLDLQPDGSILVGGGFRKIEGEPRWGIARLRGTVPVAIAPSLTQQPVSRTLFDGQQVILNVEAGGSPPLSWQWRLNGEPILGASNATFSLSPLDVTDSGRYSVSVSNAAGSAASAEAVLTVLPTPTGPGSLDLTFDPTQGGTRVGCATAGGEVAALVVQPDGKVLLGGDFVGYNSQFRKSVARIEADGGLDGGFDPGRGTDGQVLAVALQPDGKVIIGGEFTLVDTQPRVSLARLNVDGSLDSAFVADVGVATNKGSVQVLALQGDGKILVGGWFKTVRGTARANLARLNADGSVDLGFDSGTQFDELYGSVRALRLLPDGKLLVGGVYGTDRRVLYRLNRDGSADPAFANEVTGLCVRALAVRSDGKFYASGDLDVPGETWSVDALVLVNADGTLDRSYPILKAPVATLHLQTDERLVITGWFDAVRGVPRHHLARLRPDGSVDESFDPGTLVGLWGPQQGSILALAADDSFWLTGNFTLPDGTSSSLLRLRPDGTLDQEFHSGIGIIAVAGDDAFVGQASVQPDGRILVVGRFDAINGQSRVNLARLFPDGTVDPNFRPKWTSDAAVVAFAELPDGRLIVGGNGSFVGLDGRRYEGLVRLDPGGFLDETFMSPWSDTWNMRLHCLALQDDGKILLGGEFENGLARLNPDGSWDETFHPPLLPAYDGDAVHALRLQPDGKILVGGTHGIGFFQLNPAGTLDSGFSLDPRLYADVRAIALQPDGRILIGGFIFVEGEDSRRNLVRLLPDGRLDAGFQARIEIEPTEILWTPQGRIVVAGGTSTPGAECRVYRLGTDGTPDPTFNASVNAYLGTAAIVTLAVQADGRLLIGGAFTSANGLPLNAVARLENEALPYLRVAAPPQEDTFRIELLGTPGAVYCFETSTNLTDWSAAGCVTNGPTGWAEFLCRTARNDACRFYRSSTQTLALPTREGHLASPAGAGPPQPPSPTLRGPSATLDEKQTTARRSRCTSPGPSRSRTPDSSSAQRRGRQAMNSDAPESFLGQAPLGHPAIADTRHRQMLLQRATSR